MQLNKCFPVKMAAPTAVLHVTGIQISWSHPSYPKVKPEKYLITLSETNSGANETRTTSDTTIAFYGLTKSTSYTVTLKAVWDHHGLYTTDELSYKTLAPAALSTEGRIKVQSNAPISPPPSPINHYTAAYNQDSICKIGH